MTTYYINSVDGNNADSGATWALAKADLQQTWAAGDILYVSDNHAETKATTLTIPTAGTAASPTKIYGVNDAAEPPTSLSTTATVTTTGTASISLTAASGGAAYLYGLTFSAGTTTGGGIVFGSAAQWQFEDCNFYLLNTGGSSVIDVCNGVRTIVHWKNCNVKFGAAAQSITTGQASGRFFWDGGSLSSGGTLPTTLIKNTGSSNEHFISGVDLSNGSSSMNLAAACATQKIVWRNCKLPASWSGALVTGTLSTSERHEMYNCDAGDTNYRTKVMDYMGTLDTDTAVYSDTGATDGTTRLSWKVVTTANSEYPNLPFVTPEIVKWNDTTGSALTVTVEINHASQGAGTDGALQNDEIWLEVMYLGTSGFPLGTWTSNRKVPLATAASHATTATAWTGDSAGWDTQKLVSASITPQEKGYIHARICVAKASATVYIDPLLTVA